MLEWSAQTRGCRRFHSPHICATVVELEHEIRLTGCRKYAAKFPQHARRGEILLGFGAYNWAFGTGLRGRAAIRQSGSICKLAYPQSIEPSDACFAI